MKGYYSWISLHIFLRIPTWEDVDGENFGGNEKVLRGWEKKFRDLSAGPENIFIQRIVGLPPLDQEHHLPHHASFRFDTSAKEWDCKREDQLRRHGIHALTTVLQSETTVLLLSGWPHTFKKVCCAQRSHNPPTPLVGFAGDISYIGATPEVVIRELYKIVIGHRLLRRQHQGVYCFWQLAFWCLIDLYGSVDPANNTAIIEVHLLASLPYVEEMLDEEKQYAYLSGNQAEVLDEDSLSDEYVCSICKVCLWNMILKVVVAPTSTPPPPSSSAKKSTKRRRTTTTPTAPTIDENDDEPLSMLCGQCAAETLKSKNITTQCVFRFGPTAQLRQQFDQVRAKHEFLEIIY